eukprot:Sspe_Gene.4128::Locus_1362_Transcript_1_1_Confidence_1.000_Length_1310::g.4128::m.4128/K04802/PCNA; proliferating cell nuclear antigen
MVLKASRNVDSKLEINPKEPSKEEGLVKVKEEKKEGVKKPREDDEEEEVETAKKKRKGQDGKVVQKAPEGVRVECEEPVTLQFALRYLTMFSKASAVSDTVRMKLAKDVPLQVEFEIFNDEKEGADSGERKRMGVIRFYLAPKVGESNDDAGSEE